MLGVLTSGPEIVFEWCIVILPDIVRLTRKRICKRKTRAQECQIVGVEVVAVTLGKVQLANGDVMGRSDPERESAGVCAVRQK